MLLSQARQLQDNGKSSIIEFLKAKKYKILLKAKLFDPKRTFTDLDNNNNNNSRNSNKNKNNNK